MKLADVIAMALSDDQIKQIIPGIKIIYYKDFRSCHDLDDALPNDKDYLPFAKWPSDFVDNRR